MALNGVITMDKKQLIKFIKDIKMSGGEICTWLSNGREYDIYIDGWNSALDEILEKLKEDKRQ